MGDFLYYYIAFSIPFRLSTTFSNSGGKTTKRITFACLEPKFTCNFDKWPISVYKKCLHFFYFFITPSLKIVGQFVVC